MADYLSNSAIDELGDGYIRKFYEACPKDSLCVDIDGFAEFLHLNVVYEAIREDNMDKIGFLADGKTPLWVFRNGERIQHVFANKTVVLDNVLLNDNMSARRRFTLAHEIAHYLLDKLTKRLSEARFHSEYDSEKRYTADELKSQMSITENRADRLAAAFLMPSFNMTKAIEKYSENQKFIIYGENIILPEEKTKIRFMASGLGVSFSALLIRLKNMGYIDYHTFDEFVAQDLQEGDFSDEDINYDRRFGQLTKEQTYLIHRSRREADSLEKRTLKCPACGLKMAEVRCDSNGHTRLKCQKCKFEEALNLAYFRTAKTMHRTLRYRSCQSGRKKQTR